MFHRFLYLIYYNLFHTHLFYFWNLNTSLLALST